MPILKVSAPQRFGLSIAVLALVSVAAFAALIGPFRLPATVSAWARPEVRDALSGLAEVTVGVLGVAVTVVAILLELAATRFSPRITQLFLRDPLNVAVMSFYIALTLLTLWTTWSLYQPPWPSALVSALEAAMTLGFLLILPYFAYVLDFLSPSRIVERLERQGSTALLQTPPTREPLREVLEQLGDIAHSAADARDKAVGLAALSALAHLGEVAIAHKPPAGPWFDVRDLGRSDPDFIALDPEVLDRLVERRTWVEMKIFRQFQAVFSDALHHNRDLAHLVAILTRKMGEHALENRDGPALDLTLRWMNTWLRAAINASDVRTAYNLFQEYRGLGSALISAGDAERTLVVAERFKYYGQLGFFKSIPFLLETAAYDLGALIEGAHRQKLPLHTELLGIFLEVDREPDPTSAADTALRGVRKAQVKLALHYLHHGETVFARQIFSDMRSEPAARIASIHLELASIADREFWEISDRGTNFDYLPPALHAHLPAFFAWFSEEGLS